MVDASTLIKDIRFVEIYDNEILLKNEKSQWTVVIDRKTFAVTKRASNIGSAGSSFCTFPIQGVYGIIELSSTKYLALITKANYIGEILSKQIFQIEKIIYVPLDKRIAITNTKNIPCAEEDKTYIDMLNDFFSKKFLYFSYDFDLTSTLQRQCETNFEKGKWKSQYFFNQVFMNDFLSNSDLSEWVAPVISGIVEIKHLPVNQTEIDFILISRRDKRRTGMRYVSRGCDLEGNCSNTADTEQILVIYKKNSFDTRVFSYVQLRGSMPFLWQQKPDLKWEPKGDIYQANSNLDVARKHFEAIKKDYGNQVAINLIDKKRIQQKLGAEFQRVVEEIIKNDPALRYVWFDFHHELKNMKYENLSRLLNLVETDTSSMGMFEVEIKKVNNVLTPEIKQKQKGTFRTNCVDCLDRTNVVQSVIGRKLLHFALIHAGLSDKKLLGLGPFEKFSEPLETTFRDIWTKNADALSIMYTGTGALKTDFTRTGKRTKQGALQDGKNSIMRYVKNHFYDGYNQNCVDLALGKYKPKDKDYKKQKINNFFILGFLVLVTPVVMVTLLNTLHTEIYDSNNVNFNSKVKGVIFYATVFGLSIYMLFKGISSNPQKFIEKPILKH